MQKKDNKPRQTRSQTKTSFSYPFAAAGIVILLVLSPWLLFLNEFQPEKDPNKDPELEHYINEVSDNIKNYIVKNATQITRLYPENNSNLTAFKARLNANLNNIISSKYQPFLVEGKDIEININYYTLDVCPVFSNTNDLIRHPRTTGASEEQAELETFIAGVYYDSSVPNSYCLQLDLQLTGRHLKDDKNGDDSLSSVKRTVNIQEILQIPYLFIEYKLQQFQNQGVGANSDLARMMRYMLTTLARMRVLNLDDFGSQVSYKNIISEGDVELILNLAIIFEEAMLFRRYDKGAVNSIDQNFFWASEAAHRENPTGKREWGTAELSNYYDYLSRRSLLNNQDVRALAELTNKYVTSGYIDPADLMALYMVLDMDTRPAIIDSTADTKAILEEEYYTRNLMDPKTPDDASDTTNLKFISSIAQDYEQGFNLTSKSNGRDHELFQNVKLVVDHEPNYLILDADFKLNGLDEPRGWFTTASPRQDAFGSGGRYLYTSSGTRTPSVVKERPMDHDYRMDWKLNLEGKFSLNVRSMNDLITPGQNRIIELDLPINIYVWFNKDPKIIPPEFIDLNSGGALTSGNWEITSQSHLVEYFESELWIYLKLFVELGFDNVYSILPRVLAEQGLNSYYQNHRKYQNNLLIGYNPISSNWLTDLLLHQTKNLKKIFNRNLEDFWIKFDIFMADYFLDYLDQYDDEYDLFNLTSAPQFPHPPLVPWLSSLGYEVALHYDQVTKIVNITILHPTGYFSFIISGFESTIEQFSIVLKSHLEVENLINLDTTISSRDQILDKPEFFADGLIFNTYRFTTRTYPKPTKLALEASSESNEQLLFTRAKFGVLYSVADLKLPELSLSSDLQDVSVALTINIPEEQKALEQIESLQNAINSIDLDLTKMSEQDRLIQHRVFLTRVFNELSEKLLSWHESSGSNIRLALEFGLKSSNKFTNLDFTNLTVFLTELNSLRNFLSWLGVHGLDLLLALDNPDTILNDLAHTLTNDKLFLTETDLALIDFELSNRVLDHDLQKRMSVQDNIINQYQFPSTEAENLTLVEVIPGDALVAAANGLVISNDNSNGNAIETFTQVFYCYQTTGSENKILNLLMGTSYFN